MHSFNVGDYVTPTSQVKVRFEASDLNSGSVVEAGVDAFKVSSFTCEDPGLPEDLNGDGCVNVTDLLILLGNWGADGSGAELAEPYDLVNVSDLLVLLGAWGAGCP